MIIFSQGFEEHFRRLQAVFDRLRKANLKLKPSKCVLFAAEVKFLGSVVSSEGIAPDPDKVEAVRTWPTPTNLTETRAFVALAGYYRKHIAGFSTIARPLHELTKKNVAFFWGAEQEAAFRSLKERLTSAPVLAMPEDLGLYVLDTDANATAAGAVLQQWQNGELKVIAYGSKSFSPAEVRYCTTRRELAAVMFGLYQYRHLLLGRKFELRTDHAALTHLRRTPDPVGQSARYLDRLAEYDFDLKYRPGEQHQNADALSRRPCERSPNAAECNQCRSKAIRTAEEAARRASLAAAPEEGESQRCQVLRSRKRSSKENATAPRKCPKATGTDGTASTGEGLTMSKELLREQQSADEVVGSVIRFLFAAGQELPGEEIEASTLRGLDPKVQHLYAQRQSLRMLDGVLYRQYERTDGTLQYNQVVVPRTLREEFLRAFCFDLSLEDFSR